MKQLGIQIKRLGILVFLCLFIGCSVTCCSGVEWLKVSRERATLESTQDESEKLLSNVHDLERGFRGFLLTNEQQYLAPYKRASTDLDDSLAELQKLSDNGFNLEKLVQLVREKKHFTEHCLATFNTKGLGAALVEVRTHEGLRVTEQIEGIIHLLQDKTRAKLSHCIQRIPVYAGLTIGLAAGSDLIVLLTIGFILFKFQETLRAQENAEQKMHEGVMAIDNIITCPHYVIVVANSKGIMTDVSRTAADVLGYEHKELIGQPVDILIPYRYRESHHKAMEHLLRNPGDQQQQRIQGHCLRKNGTEFPCEVNPSVIMTTGQVFLTTMIVDTSPMQLQITKERQHLQSQIAKLQEVHDRSENATGDVRQATEGLDAIAKELQGYLNRNN